MSDAERDEFYAREVTIGTARVFASACAARAKDLLPVVGTENVARDLEVLRRLRALLLRVREACPPERRAPLNERLSLLDEIARHYTNPIDRRMARQADSQGLGGGRAFCR